MTFTYPSHTTKGCVPLSSDVRVRLNKLIDKIKLAEDKTDNDEFVELIKRYVIDEDIEFDVAKNLITEYKKIKEKSKNG